MNWLLDLCHSIAHQHKWREVPGPKLKGYHYLYHIKEVCDDCGKVLLSSPNGKFRSWSYWSEKGVQVNPDE